MGKHLFYWRLFLKFSYELGGTDVGSIMITSIGILNGQLVFNIVMPMLQSRQDMPFLCMTG